ncbi:MAG: putative bacterial sensory transduction regulator [Phormidium sp. OSCR]|nr:MAG: putative bacterial sensory transduction regulator [Phormidium sp. OSCR]
MQDNIATDDIVTDDWTGENDVVNYPQEIETVISSLAQDQKAMVGHSDDAYAWKFKYGSVEVFVQLTGDTEEDMFTVWSPVLKLPATDEPGLMRHLLQMNWGSTFESRFAIVEDQVVVLSSRTVADLNPGEISRTITIVATIADDNDEDLQEKYGAS